MTLEEYKKKKLEKVDHIFNGHPIMRRKEMLELMSQTIDELGKLPEGLECVDDSLTWEDTIHNSNDVRFGWNACIAEAERTRDLNIKGKR